MWLLLERRPGEADATARAIEAGGYAVEVVTREDQLTGIDPARVALALAGPGWTAATVERLRGDGVRGPWIAIVGEDEDLRERARELGCVDAVRLPVSVPYLSAWLPRPAAERSEDAARPAASGTALSAMERILSARDVARAHKAARKAEDSPVLRGRIVPVMSARDGVGKTTLALALATHWQQRRFRVALVDLAPAGILMALLRASAVGMTTEEWTKLPSRMDEPSIRQSTLATRGFWLLPAGRDARRNRELDEGTIRKILVNLASVFDAVIVDTAPDTPHLWVLREMAHHIVYPLRPDWFSLARYTEGLQSLQAHKGADGVTPVLNHMTRVDVDRRVARLAQEQGAEPLVLVVQDSLLAHQMADDRPLTGGRDLAAAMRALSRRVGLDPVLEDEAAAPARKGWWWR